MHVLPCGIIKNELMNRPSGLKGLFYHTVAALPICMLCQNSSNACTTEYTVLCFSHCAPWGFAYWTCCCGEL